MPDVRFCDFKLRRCFQFCFYIFSFLQRAVHGSLVPKNDLSLSKSNSPHTRMMSAILFDLAWTEHFHKKCIVPKGASNRLSGESLCAMHMFLSKNKTYITEGRPLPTLSLALIHDTFVVIASNFVIYDCYVKVVIPNLGQNAFLTRILRMRMILWLLFHCRRFFFQCTLVCRFSSSRVCCRRGLFRGFPSCAPLYFLACHCTTLKSLLPCLCVS